MFFNRFEKYFVIIITAIVFVYIAWYFIHNNTATLVSNNVIQNTSDSINKSVYETSGAYKVDEVIDGDTLSVYINGKRELVRFMGINTPEVNNKYRKEECFGPEASKETKKLLTGKTVYLLPDPNSPNRGKYGRLLRYIFLPNGEFINAELVKDGYAFEYIYDSKPFQFMKYFNSLQQEARKNRVGLWSKKCNYYFKY